MTTYSPKEEKLNIISHALGVFMSLVFIALLLFKAFGQENIWWIVLIYGLSQFILFSASTLYHSSKNQSNRKRLKVVDHAAIYISIAGTYTPFALISLQEKEGYFLFLLIWAIAILGIILKIFFTGKFNLLSTIIYLLMGWIIVFYWSDLVSNLSENGIIWLIAGGLAYTVGAIFYTIEKINLNHFIFHVFVLLGSFCHFVSIYFHVI